MVDLSVSPAATRAKQPSWLDPRLLLGTLLVLVSIVVGARVVGGAAHSEQVWQVTKDLAPGAVLSADDLRPTRVNLFFNGPRYVALSGPGPTGYVLRRGVGAGELLPAAALARPGQDVDFREVTVAVGREHLPPELRAGQQVDVYVTPQSRSGDSAAPPRLVLPGLTVLSRSTDSSFSGSSADEEPVVLQVPPAEVQVLLAALAGGRIDLALVPHQQERAAGAAG